MNNRLQIKNTFNIVNQKKYLELLEKVTWTVRKNKEGYQCEKFGWKRKNFREEVNEKLSESK